MIFKLKHGGKPEFTPEFVELITVTCINNGGVLSKDHLLKLVGVAKDAEKKELKLFDVLLKFGAEYNFWSLNEESKITITNFEKFEKLSWSPMTFAKFLHEALSHKDLQSGKEWSSLSGLLAWSYSLKLTQSEVREVSSYLIPSKWGDFERREISRPLTEEICKNDTQWNPTKKWLKSFGMVFESKDSLNPFPQDFYEFVTANAKRDSPKTNLDHLVLKFRESFPFLPNGEFGQVWASYVREVFAKKQLPLPSEIDCPSQSDALILSEQESFVLSLLESKGIIKLDITNDAPSRYLMTSSTHKREVNYFVGSASE